jgi:hypothetical protein
MANALYDKGRNKFATGEIRWKASGGDTVRAFLVDSASYAPDLANHEFLSDIPAGARKGNYGGSGRADAPALALKDPADGACDANDTTFAAVPAWGPLGYLAIFKDDGADGRSPLIALIDAAEGLPVTPNGADITISWDDGADKVFRL